jgi:hypothetical protein
MLGGGFEDNPFWVSFTKRNQQWGKNKMKRKDLGFIELVAVAHFTSYQDAAFSKYKGRLASWLSCHRTAMPS